MMLFVFFLLLFATNETNGSSSSDSVRSTENQGELSHQNNDTGIDKTLLENFLEHPVEKKSEIKDQVNLKNGSSANFHTAKIPASKNGTVKQWTPFDDMVGHDSSSPVLSHLHTSKHTSGMLIASHVNYSGVPGRVSEKSGKCYRQAKCEPLYNKTTCFGVQLSYQFTTVELAGDSSTLSEIQERLNLWEGLRQIPRCWAVVQPLLCAVYLPECVNGSAVLPSQEMCKLARTFCKITYFGSEWPPFLRCEEDLFPAGCKNQLREKRFNTTAQCVPPLISTPRQTSWYSEVEGCGIHCDNPLLTKDEQESMKTFVGVTSSLSTVCCLFTVLTFMIDWKSVNKYPSVMIFYTNMCLLFVCVGWLAQFLPGAKDDITCRRDGTLRDGEPSSGENLSCVVVFILVYYFLIAALSWFVMLTYAWNATFQSSGESRESLENKSAYFHLVAWSLPLVLTITVMALGEVDGDSVSGVCFVAYDNPIIRSIFLLVPVTVAFFAAGYFLVNGLYKLIKLKMGSEDVLNERVSAKIQSMILRIGVFLVVMILLMICTFVCHIYEFRSLPEWQTSLRYYIACRANIIAAQSPNPEPPTSCEMKSRPSLAMLQLHLVAFLGMCIALSSWILTSATAASWKRFWCSTILRQPSNEPVKLQRHKLIAEAFARRNELNRGQGSLSFHSTHDDPVGMNLDLNSVASQDLSSTWAAAFPNFITRRGAIIAPTVPMQRHSSTSDVSHQFSLDMRRQSLDSNLSYQLAEQQWMALTRHQRRKTRKERERLLRGHNRVSPFPLVRRGSDSSQQSLALANLRRQQLAHKATVAKATSTGDLNPSTVLQPTLVISKPLAQKKNLINPPFTHGMSDKVNRLSVRQDKPVESVQTNNNNNSNSTNNNPTQSNSVVNNVATAAANPMMHPYAPFRNPYGMMGFPGFPPGYGPIYPGFPFYGMYPYGQGFAPFPDIDLAHTPLIPLHPMPDTASETSFIPIITSDSEFTDIGLRSQDEILAAQKFFQERAARCMGSSASNRPKSNQNTQTDPVIEDAAPIRTESRGKTSATSQAEMIEMQNLNSQSRKSNVSQASVRSKMSPIACLQTKQSNNNSPMQRNDAVPSRNASVRSAASCNSQHNYRSSDLSDGHPDDVYQPLLLSQPDVRVSPAGPQAIGHSFHQHSCQCPASQPTVVTYYPANQNSQLGGQLIPVDPQSGFGSHQHTSHIHHNISTPENHRQSGNQPCCFQHLEETHSCNLSVVAPAPSPDSFHCQMSVASHQPCARPNVYHSNPSERSHPPSFISNQPGLETNHQQFNQNYHEHQTCDSRFPCVHTIASITEAGFVSR